MKPISAARRLNLHRETLRRLSVADLSRVLGGKDNDTVGDSSVCASDGTGDACGPVAVVPPKKP